MRKHVPLLCACAFVMPGLALAAQAPAAQPTAPGITLPLDQPKFDRSAAQAEQDKTPVESQDRTLSTQLAETKGTIKPPKVDPGMDKAPPPNVKGTMPVIRPPANEQAK